MTGAVRSDGPGTDAETARILRVEHDDPRVQGLLDGLLEEYSERYGAEGAAAELGRFFGIHRTSVYRYTTAANPGQ